MQKMEILRKQVQQLQQLVAEKQQQIEGFQQRVTELEQLIKKQQHTIEYFKKREMQQVVLDPLQEATDSAGQRDISQLRMENGEEAPVGIRRGAAAVDGKNIYINPWGSSEVYLCEMIAHSLKWSHQPYCRCMHKYFSLAVVDGLLTSVGGWMDVDGGTDRTNALLSLTTQSTNAEMSATVFPCMPTARSEPALFTTKEVLIVAGGYDGQNNLDTVEVMDIHDKKWATARSMLHPFSVVSATMHRDQLYIAGGYSKLLKLCKSILTCSIYDLLKSRGSEENSPEVWQHIRELPVSGSTIATLGGHLVAIGGKCDSDEPSRDVRCYDAKMNSWSVIKQMKTPRMFSLAAVLPEGQLIVVGGFQSELCQKMVSVEVGRFPASAVVV